MKKNLKISLIMALVINIIGNIINYICAHFYQFIPLGFGITSGSNSRYSGFGIVLEVTKKVKGGVPQAAIDSFKVSFNFTACIIWLVITFIIVLAIVSLINALKNKKK